MLAFHPQLEADIRFQSADIRSFTEFGSELVNNGIFHTHRAELAVIYSGMFTNTLHRQALAQVHLSGPVQFIGGGIDIRLFINSELIELAHDPGSEARP